MQEPMDVQVVDQSKALLGGAAHPWRRLFARTVDVSTLGFVLLMLLAFTIGATAPEHAERFGNALQNPIAAGVILYFVWMPAEVICLTLFGATPAKWLFGIRIVAVDGNHLSIGASLRRTLLVWIQGTGLGIPLVALFTQLFAYKRLTKTGTTLWDSATGALVHHRPWGFARALACTVTVIAVLMMMAVLNAGAGK